MPTTQKEASGKWTGRARIAGVLNESRSGFDTKTEAKEWAREREKAWRNRHRPRGKGPTRTTLAEALAIDAKKTLPFKKGAVAEANRINVYLALAALPTLRPVPCSAVTEVPGSGKSEKLLKYFDIVEVPAAEPRRIVPALKGHRDELARAASSPGDTFGEIVQGLCPEFTDPINTAKCPDQFVGLILELRADKPFNRLATTDLAPVLPDTFYSQCSACS